MIGRGRGVSLLGLVAAALLHSPAPRAAGGTLQTAGTKARSGTRTAAPTSSRPRAAGTAAPGARRTTASKPAAPAPASRAALLAHAKEVRALEDLGAYGQAREALRALRSRTGPDPDLEIELALLEARSGQLDSAAARLWSPALTAALSDSMPVTRRERYGWDRGPLWLNESFDGWNWYVARARAEVASSLGRWPEARDAARLSVATRPLAGKEWLVLAVCAGRAGDLDEAAEAARRAALLDPTLPEAQYLVGLHEWRSGRPRTAHEMFRAAVALDSLYREPALALVRLRLPAAPPDSLPVDLLTGVRGTGLLTSRQRPKVEENIQMDSAPSATQGPGVTVPDSLRAGWAEDQVTIPVLIDARGRVVLHEWPWFDLSRMPAEGVGLTVRSLLEWRFQPALHLGKPEPVWGKVNIAFNR